jgi:chromate reductase
MQAFSGFSLQAPELRCSPEKESLFRYAGTVRRRRAAHSAAQENRFAPRCPTRPDRKFPANRQSASPSMAAASGADREGYCQRQAGLAMTDRRPDDLPEQESAVMSETSPVLLGMSGSLRTGSYSNAVLATLRETFAGRADLQLYDLAPIPLYNQDFEGDKRPPVVKKLLADIEAADGVVFCAPEFNHSIPGVLKNAIDWASRPAFQSVLAYKPVAIMATSRGPLGGARCLEHMKVALDSCLCRVALAREVIITAAESKIRDGRLADETSLGFACGAVEALLDDIRLWRVNALKHA